MYIHAPSIDVVTKVGAAVVAEVATAAVSAAAADIVATVSVSAIVTAAQGNVHSRHGSRLQ